MFFETVDWFDSVHPAILSIICKTADLVFNAEHHCNANGGAFPNKIKNLANFVTIPNFI